MSERTADWSYQVVGQSPLYWVALARPANGVSFSETVVGESCDVPDCALTAEHFVVQLSGRYRLEHEGRPPYEIDGYSCCSPITGIPQVYIAGPLTRTALFDVEHMVVKGKAGARIAFSELRLDAGQSQFVSEGSPGAHLLCAAGSVLVDGQPLAQFESVPIVATLTLVADTDCILFAVWPRDLPPAES